MTPCVPLIAIVAIALAAPAARAADAGFVPLFPENGVPKGWRVTTWSDLAKTAPAGVEWTVKDGVLTSQRRGDAGRGPDQVRPAGETARQQPGPADQGPATARAHRLPAPQPRRRAGANPQRPDHGAEAMMLPALFAVLTTLPAAEPAAP